MKLIKSFPLISWWWRLGFTGILLCSIKADASPTVGAHVLSFYSCGSSGGLTTPSITTQPFGSTILAWIGRGDINQFTPATAPIDDKGNTFTLVGPVHDYSPSYPGSGEALYSCLVAKGGSGHYFTAPMTGIDEITLAVVEVENGGLIQDAEWTKVLAPPQTSLSVTTTGAATLVAIWAGDSGANFVTAVPNNGFTTIDSQLEALCQVEVVVATKDVTAAGTYNVTWTSTPTQGAHMYLVAVQSAPVLQAHISGNNLAISWPTSADGFGLETNNNLSKTNSWTFVTNVPTVVGPQNIITNKISSGTEFFRLMKH
jgi:hypothetical protein